jgi:hypothetical protein
MHGQTKLLGVFAVYILNNVLEKLLDLLLVFYT